MHACVPHTPEHAAHHLKAASVNTKRTSVYPAVCESMAAGLQDAARGLPPGMSMRVPGMADFPGWAGPGAEEESRSGPGSIEPASSTGQAAGQRSVVGTQGPSVSTGEQVAATELLPGSTATGQQLESQDTSGSTKQHAQVQQMQQPSASTDTMQFEFGPLRNDSQASHAAEPWPSRVTTAGAAASSGMDASVTTASGATSGGGKTQLDAGQGDAFSSGTSAGVAARVEALLHGPQVRTRRIGLVCKACGLPQHSMG